MTEPREYTESQLAGLDAIRKKAYEIANDLDAEFDPSGFANPSMAALVKKAIQPNQPFVDLDELAKWCDLAWHGEYDGFHHHNEEIGPEIEMLRLDCGRMKILLGQKGTP